MKIDSKSSQKKEEINNYFRNTISNYEFVEYEANQLDFIYSLKKSKEDNETIREKLLQRDNWKVFRNICISAIYLGIFFAKPAWC